MPEMYNVLIYCLTKRELPMSVKLLLSLDILGRVEVLSVKENLVFWTYGNLTMRCSTAH